jgi:DNA polymerase delta subunit 1
LGLFAGDTFVKSGIRKGILPTILAALIQARSATRQLLKETDDAAQRSVLESRQKALKLTANALYGFTGVPCKTPPGLNISRPYKVLSTDSI